MTIDSKMFITIEGIEGVGKTTAKEFITQCLREANIDFVATREPGGTIIAEHIRNIFLHNEQEPICPDTELLLMFAGRAQHLHQVIKPALAKGQWVLCDRFTEATYAYQGGGRGIDDSKIAQLEQLVQGDLRPNMTLLLDADPKLTLTRVKARGRLDRIEQETVAFHQRVRDKYLAPAQAHPERFHIIDGGAPLEAVQAQLRQVLSTLCPA